jgi:hypothetical protein
MAEHNTYLPIRHHDDDFRQEQTSRWVCWALYAGIAIALVVVVGIPLYLGTR